MIILIFMLLLPILEIAVFIAVGDEIGFFNAILLCIGAALLGGFLVQQQGLKTAGSIQDSLNRGEMPMQDIFAGICQFMAGILLIVPGFLTDILALILLVPWTRTLLRAAMARYFVGEPVIIRSGQTYGRAHGQTRNGDIIDAEYVEVSATEIKDEEPPRLN